MLLGTANHRIWKLTTVTATTKTLSHYTEAMYDQQHYLPSHNEHHERH
jgi:hypothetical protein